ncbi:MAG: hypothetical protein OXS50_09215 [Gammaproteobacteria bacterium]|nr:hypothetical protein [Gammaproteobacteria bacterium]
MAYTMFIDDLRDPPTQGGWDVVARSYDAVFECIARRGCPKVVSFDHDLGAEVPSGYDIVKRLVEMDLDGDLQLPDGFEFHVHSMNPVGAENIRTLLSNYIDSKRAQSSGE